MVVLILAEARWGSAAGGALHRDVGWLFGVWETLDTSHSPHATMVSMGVPLWALPAYEEPPGTEKSLEATGWG